VTTPIPTAPADAASTAGLTTAEAEARLRTHGPNRLTEAPGRPTWQVFVDQFRNLLVIVLIGAAVLAAVVGDLKDVVVITVVLLLNAILGFVQEHRADQSLAALRSMLTPTTRARRDGQTVELAVEDLVPGDVVLVEAGDRVPADGVLVAAHSLEVDESMLTGESVATHKELGGAVDGGPVGERSGAVFMNTTVTRGRAEVEVTATGMATEVGAIAELLRSTTQEDTPLQIQLHDLGRRLALVAGLAVALFLTLELTRGEPLADTLISAVALAVAAIPEGLPAVVTVTLSVGTLALARRGAIVKRLASVETLGATSVICSDKTGTLTLNQMTAQALIVGDEHLAVSGSGYGTDGAIDRPTSPEAELAVHRALVAMALCNDASVTDGELIGDPTEGALVTLAQKGGVDVDRDRARLPRVAEVPFDSARKFMATVHADGDPAMPPSGAVLYVKGALDVLLERSRVDAGERTRLLATLDQLADQGLRVLAVAGRELAPGEIPEPDTDPDDLLDLVRDLDVLAVVGLLDPPRPEAADAIALCRRAGVNVKMITGDHARTAAAIAARLGIVGEVMTGADLDELDDEELSARVDGIGVVARVSPEHKVRMVRVLRGRGHVVAMTGDGVNDAPALKAADIGVAMGITGTEVSKEAADMVLTDDNFATIVGAVEQGRTIYTNILKFVRFQLSTNIGAVLTLLGAPLLGLPVPFTALQILWVNLIMDGPPAMALGIDPPGRSVMSESPRDPRGRILSTRRLTILTATGLVMAAGTLGVLAFSTSGDGTEAHALTLTFTTFVLFQVFNAFNARDDVATAFHRDSLRNRTLWIALAVVVALQAAAVHLEPVQRIFETTDFTAWDWVLSIAVASSVLWVEELRKAVVRRRRRDEAGVTISAS
jgi:Ca2+-transporting ATPase